ncbi:MAG: hypothetical protein GPJ00_20385 [Microcystis aeruginosa W13-18]|nr:hypothetical protein [Microcystis aeruginosa W13-18]NCR51124.1 hypothetical protein [Microcystis aeruginosa S11-01]
MTTATIKMYSLALSFNTDNVSAGEYVSFLDPLTCINIALSQDGNGNWKAIITNPHEKTNQYPEPVTVQPGSTVPIGIIDQVNYSVQFSNDGDARIFQSIRATITGV